MWKGIAITAICIMNIGIAKYAGPFVVITMFFSMYAIGAVTEAD